jgi:hypothetical protein
LDVFKQAPGHKGNFRARAVNFWAEDKASKRRFFKKSAQKTFNQWGQRGRRGRRRWSGMTSRVGLVGRPRAKREAIPTIIIYDRGINV